MRPDAQQPFFIVGAPRSGTTLLRLMLNRHSRIAIPPESHFIVELRRQLRRDFTLEEFWAMLTAHPRFREWNIAADPLQRRLRDGPVDLAALLRTTFQEYARQRGKPRWGDKTPDYVEHIGLLHELFPEAKFIHLIRDGRDVACSLRDVPWHAGGTADIAEQWRRMVEAGRAAGRWLGAVRYQETRYESLVEDPERVLRAICGFVGEEFEREMLEFYTDTTREIPANRLSWHQTATAPLTTRKIGRWRQELSNADLAAFEGRAGRLLRELDYASVARGMRDVVIMGSGRSGTSMLAGTLARSGYFMGENLWPPQQNNPRGFYEDREINSINELLLNQVYPRRHRLIPARWCRSRPVSWQQWLARVPPGTPIPCPAVLGERIRALTVRRPFCFKDPRFCYTLPAWRAFLGDARFVCVFRDPSSTAKSILKEAAQVDHLKNFSIDLAGALEVWTLMYRHVLEIHRREGDWLFVHYNQVLSGDAAARVELFLGAQVDRAFADATLRRCFSTETVPAATQAVYLQLCELAGYDPAGD